MEMCRMCLAMDRKMFALDTQYKQLYENFTGISVPLIDLLPKFICWECKYFISKYLAFKSKAVTSHHILMEVLTIQNKTLTTPEMHQTKSTLIRTNIICLNLDGVDHDKLQETVAIDTFKSYDNSEMKVKSEVDDKSIDDQDVIEYKNETDHIWEEEKTFTIYDNADISVTSEVDEKPLDYINEEPYVKTKETFENISQDGPHCERCELSFASQEEFDDHKICSAKRPDERTTKITPRLTEPMVVNGVQFAKSPRVELWEYTAPPEYAGIFGAPLIKRKADSHKVTNNKKDLKSFNSELIFPDLSSTTEHLEETKHEANYTETLVVDENNSFVETSKDKFICNECGQQFDKKDSIILHVKRNNTKDIQCKKEKQRCGKKKNVSKTHKTVTPYSCTRCGKKFSNKHNLSSHKKIHTKQFNRRCDNFNVHMRTHTDEKPNSCTVCKKVFVNSKNMIPHMRIHTGEKPYSCTVCNKQFKRSDHLVTHMRLHTGEKPYSCTVCKKLFISSSHMTAHMRTHTGEKPYSCTVCKKQFYHASFLNRHMSTHTSEKPYSCMVCNKQFKRIDCLNVHIQSLCVKLTNPHWARMVD